MMSSTQYISDQLKAARKSRGLSQRELSEKSGVPQGHISKIESGNVDLRLSSLVAIARVLGMELSLIPLKYLPAVDSIVGSVLKEDHAEPPRPAYSLDDEDN